MTSAVTPSPLATRDLGPAPEPEIIRDLAKRAAMVAPLVIGGGFLGWGWAGAASLAIGLAITIANFATAAALQAWAARISLGLVMGVALFGFLIRLAVVSLIVIGLDQVSWIVTLPLALTIVFGHLGLLIWETRFVSASLAFPGLKPAPLKEKP